MLADHAGRRCEVDLAQMKKMFVEKPDNRYWAIVLCSVNAGILPDKESDPLDVYWGEPKCPHKTGDAYITVLPRRLRDRGGKPFICCWISDSNEAPFR